MIIMQLLSVASCLFIYRDMWGGRNEDVGFKIGRVLVSKCMFIRVSKRSISPSTYWMKTREDWRHHSKTLYGKN
jgi:hypothetical protein